MGKEQFKERFYITGLGKQKMILGLPWLKKHNPLVNWKNGTLTWKTAPICLLKTEPVTRRLLSLLEKTRTPINIFATDRTKRTNILTPLQRQLVEKWNIWRKENETTDYKPITNDKTTQLPEIEEIPDEDERKTTLLLLLRKEETKSCWNY